MNKFLILSLSLGLNFQVNSSCSLKDANDVLGLIKKNHPQITLNKAKKHAIEKLLEKASQSPNPELNINSSFGDSIEGDVYTTSLSLQHVLELGGKQSARMKVAEKSIKARKSFSGLEDQRSLIDAVLKLHRLRQVHELIPLYKESLNAFNKILKTLKRRRSLSPEQEVESETLALASNDYKLKISQLNSEKDNLEKHLSYYMGKKCTLPMEVLPSSVDLEKKFQKGQTIEKDKKVNAAKNLLELAKATLDLEKSNSYPNLKIGPTYEYEKVNIRGSTRMGLSLTIDLPLFNINSGGRAKAVRDIVSAEVNLKNSQIESSLDLEAWILKYNEFKFSLKTIANKNDLERKHRKIENLFKRGIISTSLVIESHRQLIEFSNTRFEFEQGATEALWNIYKMTGKIKDQKI